MFIYIVYQYIQPLLHLNNPFSCKCRVVHWFGKCWFGNFLYVTQVWFQLHVIRSLRLHNGRVFFHLCNTCT